LAINAPSPASTPDDPSESILEFPDNRLLIDLCGELDRNLVQVESRLGVAIQRRGNHLSLHGGMA
jgi:phosphate starvation-inducible PhoH-like protein